LGWVVVLSVVLRSAVTWTLDIRGSNAVPVTSTFLTR
jgi:hypothetical protein